MMVHARVSNPLPQDVHGKMVQVVAHHRTLDGPELYNFTRDLDARRYVVPALSTATWDFELMPASEVSFDVLFHPTELVRIATEAKAMEFPLGLEMNLTFASSDGEDRVGLYKLDGVRSHLCLHVRSPTENCGGLPLMSPASALSFLAA